MFTYENIVMFTMIFFISNLMVISCYELWEVKKCYKSFCFAWFGEAKAKNELPSCQDGYWDLEIYDTHVEAEVKDFLKYIILLYKDRIKGMFVYLNIICEDLQKCYWRRHNTSVVYKKWDVNVYEISKHAYIEADPNKVDKWRMSSQHNFTKICMTKFSAILASLLSVFVIIIFSLLCMVMVFLEQRTIQRSASRLSNRHKHKSKSMNKHKKRTTNKSSSVKKQPSVVKKQPSTDETEEQ